MRTEIIKDESGQYVEREFVEALLPWQKQGLQQTATGYGARLNTGFKVMYAGKMRRVYCICYSNAGSMYVMVKGKRNFL